MVDLGANRGGGAACPFSPRPSDSLPTWQLSRGLRYGARLGLVQGQGGAWQGRPPPHRLVLLPPVCPPPCRPFVRPRGCRREREEVETVPQSCSALPGGRRVTRRRTQAVGWGGFESAPSLTGSLTHKGAPCRGNGCGEGGQACLDLQRSCCVCVCVCVLQAPPPHLCCIPAPYLFHQKLKR